MTAATADRRWVTLAYGYGVLVAAVLGWFLLRIPIQLTDSFTTLLSAAVPFGELIRSQFLQVGYLRPGLWVLIKAVYDLSQGEFFYWFRITHVLQAGLLVLLLVHVLRPRTPRDVLVVPLALTVLLGSHTFAWTVREAYPFNSFLTILLCCAAAVALSSASPRWWTTPAAVLLFAVAALTLESGLLVWVIFVTGYVVGWRGVSRRGLVALCGVLAGYFVLRFVLLGNGLPPLVEREAGFGFSRRLSSEIVASLGGSALPFYAYNVVASMLSVLVGEPRDGVFKLAASMMRGDAQPALLVGAVSSVLTTLVIAHYAWSRRRLWLARQFSHGDRLVIVFGAVFIANAVMCFAYTKDMIMSPTGLMQAAAVYVAVGALLERPRGAMARAGVAALLLVLSTSWAVRAAGLHAALDRTAVVVREQWAYVDDWMERSGSGTSPTREVLKQYLRDDANLRHPSHPQLRDELTRLFELD